MNPSNIPIGRRTFLAGLTSAALQLNASGQAPASMRPCQIKREHGISPVNTFSMAGMSSADTLFAAWSPAHDMRLLHTTSGGNPRTSTSSRI
jgi:hypothetical protein